MYPHKDAPQCQKPCRREINVPLPLTVTSLLPASAPTRYIPWNVNPVLKYIALRMDLLPRKRKHSLLDILGYKYT